MGMIFVTHDLGVAGEVADRIAVMYAGRFIEEGPVAALMRAIRCTHTRRGCWAPPSTPVRAAPGWRRSRGRRRIWNIRWWGAPFAPRCAYVEPACLSAVIPEPRHPEPGRAARCVRVADRVAAAA